MYDMVSRTRIEGGGYSKRDIITWYDQADCNIIVDVLQSTEQCDYITISTINNIHYGDIYSE